MSRKLLLWLGGGCVALPAWLTGCATPLPAEHAAPPAVVSAPLRAAQQGHGALASFALCEATQCPQPTPKSFAAMGVLPGATREPPDATFVAPMPDRPP